MKRALAIVSVIALLLVVASAPLFAQAKPNFAGKWTQVVDPNAPALTGRGRGAGGLGAAFAAAQDEKTLTVTTNNPQTGESTAVYNLDGSETKNPLTMGRNRVDRVSKARWNGSRLVITTTNNFNGNLIETTQSWSLDASGSLTVESTSSPIDRLSANVGFGQGNPTTTKATYKKG